MSVKKFKFVSPGVFINEIDNSQLPQPPAQEGPTLVGRSLRGPALRPVQVDSLEQLVEVFGPPIAGNENVDAFRNPAYGAATYGLYAAEAWLRNNPTVNFVRLIGRQDPNYTVDSGEAGWRLAPYSASADGGGAYGIYVFNSQSSGHHTGTLGAVVYCDSNTSVGVSGSLAGNGTAIQGGCALIEADDGDITVRIITGAGLVETAVNFDRTSRKYIRSVLNTNPTKTNSEVTPSTDLQEYFLGETFERAIEEEIGGISNIAHTMVIPLKSGSLDGADFRQGFVDSQTGWIISQDLNTTPTGFNPELDTRAQKLFKLHGLKTGEYDQGNIKVSVENIIPSKTPGQHGTFNVVVRRMDDNDAKVREVERFNAVTLNPNSPNYIGAQIGDRFTEWNNEKRVYDEYGQYENQSSYVRVEVAQTIDDGASDPTLLPYGFFGPLKYKNISNLSGSSLSNGEFGVGTGSLPDNQRPSVTSNASGDLLLGKANEISIRMPRIPLRTTTAVGDVSSVNAAFFGLTTTRASGSTTFDDSVGDILRSKPSGISSFTAGNVTEVSHIFTLDDIVLNGGVLSYSSGSRAGGTSLTATSGAYAVLTGTAAPKGFTMPLFGGFDGMDITEKDPFANKNTSGESERSSYAYHTLTVAMDSFKDTEVIETNVVSVPGVTTAGLTDKLLDLAEDRGDCLAVIDLAGGYQPPAETTNTFQNRVGSVDSTVKQLNNRAINTSYGCAFYPWVRAKDSFSDTTVWLPPSVAAIGAFSFTDRNAEPWFAPAGFNRGGLSKGAGGLQVVGVADRLRSRDRDDLYEANINPIGTFPNEGVVILGQKTLQTTPSALDRINVRRLLIYTKRQITAVANDILFEQNVQATWNNFISKAEPILDDIQAGFGLEEYRLVLDESTTTPELRDRNVLYAKVFLKPAKSIEFIALDFIITNSAAVFE